METTYKSDNRQLMFSLTITTERDMPVRIVASDPKKPYTDYTDRYYNFIAKKPATFKLRLPLI